MKARFFTLSKVYLCLFSAFIAAVVFNCSFTKAYALEYTAGDGIVYVNSVEICSADKLQNIAGELQIDGNITLEGAIPSFSVPSNYQLENELNQILNNIYVQKLEHAKQSSARSISFRYENKTYLNYGSVLVFITTATGQQKDEVVSINYDTQRGALISIYDLLGLNAAALINTAVSDEMRRTPDNYNTSFAGVVSDVDFYVENGNICVLFDKYEIAPGSRGIVSINIALNSLESAVIPKSQYLVKTSQYGLKMLPLRSICQILGFTISWNENTKVAEIANGSFTVKCAVDENRYYKLGESPRSLESSPEIIDGVIYVPVSFLSSMLNIVYTFDPEENIILSYIH